MTTSVSKTSVSKRTRGVTWTLFNYEPYIDAIQQYAKDECSYMIYGIETCPETQRKHLQGYLYYENARQYPVKKWRKLTEDNGRDFISAGTPLQNQVYCSKGGDVWEYGELPQQGGRTDWELARQGLINETVASVIEQQPHLIPNIRALERYQQISLRPLNRDVETVVLIGDAGVGKSRWAYDNYPDLYSKPDGAWFDGYTGQKTLLLDDYYGEIPYAQLLKLLDRYPVQVPIKGAFVYAQWDKVIITSNRSPEVWYPQGLTDALNRRITIRVMEHNHAENQAISKEAFQL